MEILFLLYKRSEIDDIFKDYGLYLFFGFIISSSLEIPKNPLCDGLSKNIKGVNSISKKKQGKKIENESFTLKKLIFKFISHFE